MSVSKINKNFISRRNPIPIIYVYKQTPVASLISARCLLCGMKKNVSLTFFYYYYVIMCNLCIFKH